MQSYVFDYCHTPELVTLTNHSPHEIQPMSSVIPEEDSLQVFCLNINVCKETSLQVLLSDREQTTASLVQKDKRRQLTRDIPNDSHLLQHKFYSVQYTTVNHSISQLLVYYTIQYITVLSISQYLVYLVHLNLLMQSEVTSTCLHSIYDVFSTETSNGLQIGMTHPLDKLTVRVTGII